MDVVRDIALLVAGVAIVAGLIAIVTLELRNRERRLVGRMRDAIEVLLPPLLTAMLLGLVWAAV
ncbi:MAG: hypothetical protein HKN91_05880 [Acidimicrobiia bacterium]|nr:hypothetical protein [Acidimicrobiia bacterium]